MVLANTYHLYLRPGIPVIKKAGGLHKYMAWDGAILTDSGGYQVFSLASLRKVDEEGVTFRSHIDGSQHFLTPEAAVQYQEELGSDIIMCLDECPTPDADEKHIAGAMERTYRWAIRCLKSHRKNNQALFGIVQGGISFELRKQSAEYLSALDFPGYAIGGLSLGEPKSAMMEVIEHTTKMLPVGKPRYLMGVGAPEDILEGVALGCDMFDSVLPTRVARNGALFTNEGRVNIRNASYKEQQEPVMPACSCYTCRTFSASYLHHLFNAGELLAYRLATIHNLHFMGDLMENIRESVRDGTFESFKKSFLSGYRTTDESVRLAQKQKWFKSRPAE